MQNEVSTPTDTKACRLILADKTGKHFFFTTNIIRMEASDNYTIVYFEGRRPFVVSKVLKVYEDLLKPFGFVRTHRSHLVNTNFIQSIQQFNIIMKDDSVAEVAVKRKTRIVKQLQQEMLLNAG